MEKVSAMSNCHLTIHLPQPAIQQVMHNLWQHWVNVPRMAVVSWSMIANGKRPNNGVVRDEPSPSSPGISDADRVRVIAQAWAWIAARVPMGYEDETGFHLGMESSRC
jgi:hypothetical protein